MANAPPSSRASKVEVSLAVKEMLAAFEFESTGGAALIEVSGALVSGAGEGLEPPPPPPQEARIAATKATGTHWLVRAKTRFIETPSAQRFGSGWNVLAWRRAAKGSKAIPSGAIPPNYDKNGGT